MVKDLDKQSYYELIGSSVKPVVVQVWAEWCGPCQYFKPIIDSIASDYEDDIVVARLNIDAEMDIARELNVMDIPTVIVFNNGRQDKVIVGAHEREDMVVFLDKYLTS
jgi:thioredoxin 1